MTGDGKGPVGEPVEPGGARVVAVAAGFVVVAEAGGDSQDAGFLRASS